MVLHGWRRFLNKVTLLPQRYVLAVMGVFAQANSYGMRVTLSMTITKMVVHAATPPQQIIGETCPDLSNVTISVVSDVTSASQHELYQLYDWDEAMQGFLLSCFYYGYIVSQFSCGALSEKIGGKWIIFTGMLLAVLSTLTLPWAVQVGDVTGLVIVRVLQGIGEGSLNPGLLLMTSRWVPPNERSVFAALVFGGAQIGCAVGPYLCGLILANGTHWSYVYYVFGAIGAVWCLFWIILSFDTPNDHPFITVEEKEMLNKTVVSSILREGKKLNPTPLKAILRSAPMWALVVAYVGHSFGHCLAITILPKYFLDVLNFDMKQTGLVTALPFIAMYISSLSCGALSDFAVKRNWHSIATGRKIYVTLSSGISGVFMIMASYSGCDRTKAVALLVISMAMMGGFYCSAKVNAVDLAPNYAGTCYSIVGGWGALTGIIVPYMVGVMTPDQTITQWRAAFWVVFVIFAGSNIVFVVWGKAEQQWWDDLEKFGYPASWNGGPFGKNADDEKAKIEAGCNSNTTQVKPISFQTKLTSHPIS